MHFSNEVVTGGVWEYTFHFSDTHLKKKTIYDITLKLYSWDTKVYVFFVVSNLLKKTRFDLPVPIDIPIDVWLVGS